MLVRDQRLVVLLKCISISDALHVDYFIGAGTYAHAELLGMKFVLVKSPLSRLNVVEPKKQVSPQMIGGTWS
ncbi:hypothetical protein OUZ56_028584 [Daphnia magna]|uniref:Uncharacterized protein n=1 Tax=Daphnia magna TaxID=35525 RepID=A0ABR0B4A3_9CRUS|nr:hypothetical protein OUZ56_028584 [Daphnia magna]